MGRPYMPYFTSTVDGYLLTPQRGTKSNCFIAIFAPV
jgi:hypothetical protein